MKKIIRILFIVSICWYTYIRYEGFKETSIFIVTKVKIRAKNLELIDDLVKSVESINGKNILKIDKKKLKDIILEDIRVKDLVISTQMPDVLLIEIEEREPLVYIEYREKIYISDKFGNIYGYMKESKKYGMPLFRIKDEKEIKKYIKIMEKFRFKNEISQMYSIKNGIIITMSTGLKIITNIDVDKEKYEVVNKLYKQIKNKKRKKIEYIDLRFNDYIIKRE